MKFLSILTIFLLLTSCASKDEKEERQQNAFDLSGTYTASIKTGSEINMGLDIYNEFGRHDIYVKLERNSVLQSGEKKLLEKYKISTSEVENYFLPKMTLGKNSDKSLDIIHLDGGENISDDFGESSRFSVCTPSLRVRGKNVERATDIQYHVYYCLNGRIKKSDYQLSGELKLYVSLKYNQKRTVIESDGTTEDEILANHFYDSSSLKYKSDASSIFYNQLRGQWSGIVNNTPGFDNDLDGAFTRFRIDFENENQYFLSPVNADSIAVNGELYEYKKVLFDIKLLRDATVPLVEMHFVSKATNKRVILVGQIFSMGSFTGSIILYDKSNLEGIQIASFEHKKD